MRPEIERLLLRAGYAPEARDNRRLPTTHWLSPTGERLTNAEAEARAKKVSA